jgi:hypothetical protein
MIDRMYVSRHLACAPLATSRGDGRLQGWMTPVETSLRQPPTVVCQVTCRQSAAVRDRASSSTGLNRRVPVRSSAPRATTPISADAGPRTCATPTPPTRTSRHPGPGFPASARDIRAGREGAEPPVQEVSPQDPYLPGGSARVILSMPGAPLLLRSMTPRTPKDVAAEDRVHQRVEISARDRPLAAR